MVWFQGDESPEEVIRLAYGMEAGLQSVYAEFSAGSDDDNVRALFEKLAGIEKSHKDRLFDLYLTLHPEDRDRTAFESQVLSGVMEGGFTTAEFMEQNREAMQTVGGTLDIAMMMEVQALDLYARYSRQTRSEESRTVLHEIADEEKAHLESLGRLRDAYA